MKILTLFSLMFLSLYSHAMTFIEAQYYYPVIGSSHIGWKICSIHDSMGIFRPFAIFPIDQACDIDVLSVADKNAFAAKATNALVDLTIQLHNPDDPECYRDELISHHETPTL